jgi:putative SOS response-associated peptidase YedK
MSAQTDEIEKLVHDFQIKENILPRYNIAPGQNIPALLNQGKRTISFPKWGLVPYWAKSDAMGNKLINARSETAHEKPSFRTSFANNRCIIFSNGFYEWKKISGTSRKAPYFIKMKSGMPFVFAGLWDNWQSADGKALTTAAILTIDPNKLISTIHDSMPVILNENNIDSWLDPGSSNERLKSCMQPYPDDEMEAYQVSAYVNSPNNDSELCTEKSGLF